MTFNDCVDCPPEVLDAMPCGCPPTAFARCKGDWIRCNERYAAWSRWQDESLLGRTVAADRKTDAGTPATDEPPWESCACPGRDLSGRLIDPRGCPLHGATDESAAEDRTRTDPPGYDTYKRYVASRHHWYAAAVGHEMGSNHGSQSAARAACWAHHDAHPAVAELARVRVELSAMTLEAEGYARTLVALEQERDEARRRADALSQVVQPAWMLLQELVWSYGTDDDGSTSDFAYSDLLDMVTAAVDAARPILAKLQALPQHTVASTDQPQPPPEGRIVITPHFPEVWKAEVRAVQEVVDLVHSGHHTLACNYVRNIGLRGVPKLSGSEPNADAASGPASGACRNPSNDRSGGEANTFVTPQRSADSAIAPPPQPSEVTTSTMPRSAPVASEGEGPLGDGGIEE